MKTHYPILRGWYAEEDFRLKMGSIDRERKIPLRETVKQTVQSFHDSKLRFGHRQEKKWYKLLLDN